MATATDYIVGIDLGTTTSCVAIMEVSDGSNGLFVGFAGSCHRELGGCQNHSFGGRFSERRGKIGRAGRQAPGSRQRGPYGFLDQEAYGVGL